jgi:SagB-type dehydrogenase family enzyme
MRSGADQQGRRPYPSGGALYSAEMLVIAGEAIEGVPPFSVAHYLPVSNRFELLPGQFDRESFKGISSIKGASFYLAYFVILKKAIFKYRSRGYRLALLEIGSMYQQITNVAQEHGVASRVLAGFSEYEFTKNCGLDSRLLLPAAIQAFGFSEGDNGQ